MKIAPVVIAVVVLAGAVNLRRLRRRRAARDPAAPRGPRGAARAFGRIRTRTGRSPFGGTGLVAGREIRERLRGRVFRVVTIVLFAVVAAAVVIPTIHTSAPQRTAVGVVGVPAAAQSQLRLLARRAGIPITLVAEPGLGPARAGLADGSLDVVFDGNGTIYVQTPLSPSDSSAGARFVRDASVSLGAERAFARAALTPSQAAIVSGAKPLPVVGIRPAKKQRTTAQATALLGVILIFIVLTQYLTWTLMGVMEEKANRVVEVLLAAVRPIQLLAGKVLGIGCVALAQAGALVAFALLLADAVGSSLARGAAPLVVGATLVWMVLGYALYSWVYAAAGSLAERQDQVQSMALPLSAPLILGYIVSLVGASAPSASLLVKVLAYLPPTAPFAMPTLVGFGEVTWWQFSLSVLVCLATTVGVALVAARVYRAAVLRTGGRVRLRDLNPR